ncbi:MAG: hypothetical protein ACK46X_08125 [Candidatus Sericytochromatia bacterium]
MSDKIIPFRRPAALPKASLAQPPEAPSLAEALSHLPDDAPIMLEIKVSEPPTR